jgi:hypothetical protein
MIPSYQPVRQRHRELDVLHRAIRLVLPNASVVGDAETHQQISVSQSKEERSGASPRRVVCRIAPRIRCRRGKWLIWPSAIRDGTPSSETNECRVGSYRIKRPRPSAASPPLRPTANETKLVNFRLPTAGQFELPLTNVRRKDRPAARPTPNPMTASARLLRRERFSGKKNAADRGVVNPVVAADGAGRHTGFVARKNGCYEPRVF